MKRNHGRNILGDIGVSAIRFRVIGGMGVVLIWLFAIENNVDLFTVLARLGAIVRRFLTVGDVGNRATVLRECYVVPSCTFVLGVDIVIRRNGAGCRISSTRTTL
jgi:hypothetical protein